MKKQKFPILSIVIIVVAILVVIIVVYGYNSGSCKISKNYTCNNKFCLFKEFKVHLPDVTKKEIDHMLTMKEIQKRVNIETFPENILNCALPNKKGKTIATNNVVRYAPNLIQYFENNLCKLVSEKLSLTLFPTSLKLPTSCTILIYDNKGDWINWHYDYNYYKGRFFTVLIPITNIKTCTEFQFKTENNEIKSINLTNNNSVCFEGNFLYHRASKLCKNEKRIILSCQYVTNNDMSFVNKLRLKIKDFAYTGKLST
jgi:hypothetical protein